MRYMFRCPDCERGFDGSGDDRNAAENAAIASHRNYTRSCRFMPTPSDFHEVTPVFESPVQGSYLLQDKPKGTSGG